MQDLLANPSFAQIVYIIGGGIVALAIVLIITALILSSRNARRAAEANARARLLEEQLQGVSKSQNEISARMQTMAEIFGERQSDMAKSLNERLDQVTHRLQQNMTSSTQATSESLSKLHERLALIDKAQATIATLSTEVTGLTQILANKQTRGAFGQARMEAIIADALPESHYSFQHTLSNRNRPDCVIFLPNDQPVIAIDAKFPLEAYNMLKAAPDEAMRLQAMRQMRTDVGKHIRDISDKYLIPHETQNTAFMFVPSEALYAELHETFEDIIQQAYKARVVIVSPSLLMLSVQVVQGIMKDARMREQAHLIQKEVAVLLEDVTRLTDRVVKLRTHFDQAHKDIDLISTSAEKIGKRGQKLIDVELGDEVAASLPSGGTARGSAPAQNTIPFPGRE